MLRAFADAPLHEPVRIIGEPIWAGRTAVEYPACVQHEALINAAFRGREVTILCPYDADRLEPQVIADAYATDSVVINADGELASETYDPERAIARYNKPLAYPSDAATFSFNTEDLPKARYFAVQEAERLGLAGVRLQDLTLAVAELTTNSVRHGSRWGRCGYGPRASRSPREVHDRGSLQPIPWPAGGPRHATSWAAAA